MEYICEYSNVYKTELSQDDMDWLDREINIILSQQISYVEFILDDLKQQILSAKIANDFIKTNKDTLTKNEYCVVKVMFNDKLLSISIGAISMDNTIKYVWGIVS